MTDTNDGNLSTLFPGEEVKAGGETITLKPFAFGQLPKAIKMLRPLVDAVRSSGMAGFDGKTFFYAPDWPLRLPALMDEAGEPLLQFVAFACGKPREWLDTIGTDEGVALTAAAFRVNGDFFVARVAPMLGMSLQPQATAATGEPSSPGSSEQATVETASSA